MARNNVGNKIWTARKLPRFGWAITAAALATAMLLGLRPGVYAQSSPLTIQPSTSSVGVNNTDPQSSLDVTGTANVTGAVTVGNTVTATQFIGDGSQLTGLPSSGGSTALDKITANTTVTNNAAEANLYTFSLAGGTFSTNNVLRLTIQIIDLDVPDTTNCVLRFKYGGITLGSITVSNGGSGSDVLNAKALITFIIAADGATNAQLGTVLIYTNNVDMGSVGLVQGTSAVDSTAAQTLAVTADWDAASTTRTITLGQAILEKLS